MKSIEKMKQRFDENGADGNAELEESVEFEGRLKEVNAITNPKTSESQTCEISGENGSGRRRRAAEDERKATLPKGFIDQREGAGEKEKSGDRCVRNWR